MSHQEKFLSSLLPLLAKAAAHRDRLIRAKCLKTMCQPQILGFQPVTKRTAITKSFAIDFFHLLNGPVLHMASVEFETAKVIYLAIQVTSCGHQLACLEDSIATSFLINTGSATYFI